MDGTWWRNFDHRSFDDAGFWKSYFDREIGNGDAGIRSSGALTGEIALFKIGHQHGIVIHPKTVFGDDCVVHQNVTIGESGPNRRGEAPTFGNRVKIGAGAAIIGKVVIGDDVTIGPNATVMINIPAGTTVCAPPPRLIKLSHWSNQTKAPGPSAPEQGLLVSKE